MYVGNHAVLVVKNGAGDQQVETMHEFDLKVKWPYDPTTSQTIEAETRYLGKWRVSFIAQSTYFRFIYATRSDSCIYDIIIIDTCGKVKIVSLYLPYLKKVILFLNIYFKKSNDIL